MGKNTELAFPTLVDDSYTQHGLTKREYFAGQFLAARLSAGLNYDGEFNTEVEDAVIIADKLLKELEK